MRVERRRVAVPAARPAGDERGDRRAREEHHEDDGEKLLHAAGDTRAEQVERAAQARSANVAPATMPAPPPTGSAK
jgi:hypothetical protein